MEWAKVGYLTILNRSGESLKHAIKITQLHCGFERQKFDNWFIILACFCRFDRSFLG